VFGREWQVGGEGTSLDEQAQQFFVGSSVGRLALWFARDFEVCFPMVALCKAIVYVAAAKKPKKA
jgi:hypothetical protein